MGYLGGDSSRGDVGGAMMVVVMVVVVPPPRPVLLLLVLFLALGATLHSVHVGVGVHVGQQRGWRGQLFQGGVRRLNPDSGLTQQVDGVRQSRQNELETLLQETPASTSGAFLTHLAHSSASVSFLEDTEQTRRLSTCEPFLLPGRLIIRVLPRMPQTGLENDKKVKSKKET